MTSCCVVTLCGIHTSLESMNKQEDEKLPKTSEQPAFDSKRGQNLMIWIGSNCVYLHPASTFSPAAFQTQNFTNWQTYKDVHGCFCFFLPSTDVSLSTCLLCHMVSKLLGNIFLQDFPGISFTGAIHWEASFLISCALNSYISLSHSS